MEGLRKLRESFIAQAGKLGPLAFHDAQVLAVDETEFTCTILLDEVEYPETRLRAVVSDSQSIDVLPVVGSQVVVGKMGDDEYIVIACDEISNYQVTIGTTKFKVNGNGILISRLNETLNKILTDLVTAVLSIAAAKDAATLTALLARINLLLQ